MIWAMKFLPDGNYDDVQKLVDSLMDTLGGPHDLMMFMRGNGTEAATIYLGLPDRDLLAQFPGFVEIGGGEVPDGLTALVLREDEFQERFPEIAAKRWRRPAR